MEETRKLIYSTNGVEALHRQFRKITKSKSLYPNNDALLKMLYLAYRDLSKKWIMLVRNWAFIASQSSIIFEERFCKFIK
ncbi:MAG: transposase [Ignavibacteria bacterium]